MAQLLGDAFDAWEGGSGRGDSTTCGHVKAVRIGINHQNMTGSNYFKFRIFENYATV